jgi:hypothetical protein
MRSITVFSLVSLALLSIIAHQAVGQSFISWEAEQFTASNGDAFETLTPSFKATDSDGVEFDITEASGDVFLSSANGLGNDSGSWLKYEFNIGVAGDWYFWGRVIAPTGADNSFYWAFDIDDADAVSVDNEITNIWDYNEAAGESINFPFGDGISAAEKQQWIWFRISSRTGPFPGRGSYDDPTPLNFTAGKHTLHLIHREDGTYVDKIFATTEAGFNANETDPATSVQPQGKLATKWGDVKRGF